MITSLFLLSAMAISISPAKTSARRQIIVHHQEQGIWEGADVTDDGNTSTFTVFGNTSRTMPLNMLLAPPAAAIAHQPDALDYRGCPLVHLLYIFVLRIPCVVRFLAN